MSTAHKIWTSNQVARLNQAKSMIWCLYQKLVRTSGRSAETEQAGRFSKDRETWRCISALQDPLLAFFFVFWVPMPQRPVL